jgi:outer membrane protein assembly factor BamB
LAAAVLVLVIAAACGWPMDRFDQARTGYNPLERTIGPDNVASLQTVWTGPVTPGSTASTPVVAGSNVYVGDSSGRLFVFAAGGGPGCTGSPPSCPPLWTTTALFGGVSGAPAVAGDVVYVGSEGGVLYAFSATGTENCSGTPKVCSPLWLASVGDGFSPASSPLVADGTVYVGGDRLYAFDAAGSIDCGGIPKLCHPRWSADVNEFRSTQTPAFADGVVYATSSMTLAAFDAEGIEGCAGAPRVCSPLWSATPACGGLISCDLSSPAVSNGTVYVGSDQSDEFPSGGALYAYDAQGIDGCSGSPVSCEPRWRASTSAEYGAPAVANGLVYITDWYDNFFDFTHEGRLLAFDSAGTGCPVGAPSCSPLWTSGDIGEVRGSVSVANGVVYVGAGALHAFAATGDGCSGSPVVCDSLWTSPPLAGFTSSTPTPANGHVYIGEAGALRVFALG